MTIGVQRGIREDVTCRECGAVGPVRIGRSRARGKIVRVYDGIPHDPSCSQFTREQPAHLRRGRATVRKQERDGASLINGRTTAASGALGQDGDARAVHLWRMEAKQTGSTEYRLHQDTWSKLVRGALAADEEPLLHVRFLANAHRTTLVVIRKSLYDYLCDEEPELVEAHRLKNRWRIRPTSGRELMELDPPGVILLGRDFERLKETADDPD